MESFGAYLKAHREKKGIRLEEIASITKIHLHALELLEANNWDALPPEPFIRGFIIAYAKYVGLNTKEVLDRYREATGTADPPPAAEPQPTKVVASPSQIITQVRLPSGPKLITAASLVAVVGLAFLLINVGREADEGQKTADVVPTTQAPVTADAKPATEPVAPAPAVPAGEDKAVAALASAKPKPSGAFPANPGPAPASVPGTQHEVVIEGKERTWVKVVIDDNQPVESFLDVGKSASFKADKKIKVVLGNATGSRVLYNGKEAEGKQSMGTIRSFKFPPDAHFPQDVPTKKTEPAAPPASNG